MFQERYIVPMPSLIPDPLLNLSFSNICTLRPFDFHTGNYESHRFGYRQKNGKCRVTCSALSVEEKINTIADQQERNKCLAAYNFLMKCVGAAVIHLLLRKENAFGLQKNNSICLNYRIILALNSLYGQTYIHSRTGAILYTEARRLG